MRNIDLFKKTSIRERVIFSGTLSGKPIVLQGNYLIPNTLMAELGDSNTWSADVERV